MLECHVENRLGEGDKRDIRKPGRESSASCQARGEVNCASVIHLEPGGSPGNWCGPCPQELTVREGTERNSL